MRTSTIWVAIGRLIDHAFEDLALYSQTVQSALNRERDRFEDWVKSETKDMDDDAADELAELYAEDFHQLSETFPHIARRSTFIAIYATFEHSLLTCCWRVQKMTKQAFGPQDVKGDFSGAKMYLERLADIKMQSIGGWQQIDELRKIRNLLVHQDGKLRQGDQKPRDLVGRLRGVSLDEHGMVCLTDAFCARAVATMRTYASDLVKELKSSPRLRT